MSVIVDRSLYCRSWCLMMAFVNNDDYDDVSDFSEGGRGVDGGDTGTNGDA